MTRQNCLFLLTTEKAYSRFHIGVLGIQLNSNQFQYMDIENWVRRQNVLRSSRLSRWTRSQYYYLGSTAHSTWVAEEIL